ncbi:MAG: hypothetical protein ACO3JL_10015, partial [Myxococcota bacterium]
MTRCVQVWLSLWLLSCCGCATTSQPAAEDIADQGISPAANTSTEVLLLLSTDEHGWLSPLHDRERGVNQGGLVPFARALKQYEGRAPNHVGLFSVGDNWTGPFESTALQGVPMLQAMNLLEYRASVVGNHEFDFGQDVLARHARDASFPLLAANILEDKTGERPSWATPWVVVPLGPMRLGVIGLAHRRTPELTDPRNVTGLT